MEATENYPGTDSVHGSLRDVNGNRIGQFVLRPE